MGSPVHRAKQALAASVTALAAFLLVGGPSSAIAVAKPGESSHSHGGRDADRDGNRGRDDGTRNDSRRGGDHNTGTNGKGDGFGRGGGNGGAGTTANGGSTAGSGATSRSTTGAAATATTPTAASRAPQVAASTGDSEPSTASPSLPAGVSEAPEPSAGSGLSVAAPDIVAPKVTFGNGRTPGDGAIHPVVALPQQGVTVALPAVVVPAPVPFGIPQAAAKPRARLDLAAARGWESARPGQPMTSWFGLAGLLLIPLGGAALGYRQARAAKSASRLAVH